MKKTQDMQFTCKKGNTGVNKIDWIVFKTDKGDIWYHCESIKGEYTQDKNYVFIKNSQVKIKLDGELGKKFWQKIIQSVKSGERVIEMDVAGADERELQFLSHPKTREHS